MSRSNSRKIISLVSSSILLCGIAFFLAPSMAKATISQQDYSVYGGLGFINGYTQTLGRISGTEIQTIQVRLHSSAANPFNTTQIRILECSAPNCATASVEKSYESYTSSGRTIKNLSFTANSFDGFLTFNFQYSKELIGNTNVTNVPINPNKYYALWLWSNDGNTSRHYGSVGDTYSYGACYISSAHYVGNASPGSNDTSCSTNSAYGISDLYFLINGVNPVPFDFYTRFLTMTPPGSAIVSTSTPPTLGFTAFVAPEDVGKQVHFQIYPKNTVGGSGSIFGWLGGDFTNYGEWDVVASTTGIFSFSTVAPIKYPAGSYSATAKFRSQCLTIPVLGTACLNDLQDAQGLFVATTTNFVAGYASQLGVELDNVTSVINSALYSQSGTTTPLLESCNLSLSFSASKCLGALLIPSSDQLNDTFNRLYGGFLLYSPWGYVTRVGGILTGYQSVATSSLSSSNLAITFSSGSNPLYNASSTQIFKGKTITFINWNAMASSTANNYWGAGWTALNTFLSTVFGAGFLFWFWKFASRHFRP